MIYLVGMDKEKKYTAKYKVTDLGATDEYDYSYEENEGYIKLDNLSESLLKERIDYLDIATEIVKAYNLKSKVKFIYIYIYIYISRICSRNRYNIS